MADFLKIGSEKLYINDYVYINRQVADVGSVDLKVDVSREFSFPKTSQTIKVFEGANSINYNGTGVYTGFSCDLYLQDNKVWSNALCFVQDAGNQFNVIVKRGNIDFFAQLGDKLITDIDWSAYEHVNTNALAITQNAASTYIYPLCNFGKLQGGNYFVYDARYSLPAIPFSIIIDKIFTDAGFSKSGALFSETNYTQLHLGAISKIIPDFTNDVRRATQSYTIAEPLNFYDITYNSTTLNRFSLFHTALFSDIGITTSAYKVYQGLKYDIRLQCSYSFTASAAANFRATVSDGFREDQVIKTLSGAGTITGTIDLQYYDYCPFQDMNVYFYVETTGDSSLTLTSIILTAHITGYNNFPAAIPFDFSLNLPKIKQSDFIRLVCQLFGAYICTDEYSKTVYFTMFKEVAAAKAAGNYHDWSGFIIDKDYEVDYNTGHARILQMKYDDDSIGTDFIDTGNDSNAREEIFLGIKSLVPAVYENLSGSFPQFEAYKDNDSIAQTDEVTLTTGSSGNLILTIRGTNYTTAYSTSYAVTANSFIANHRRELASHGVTVSSGGSGIIRFFYVRGQVETIADFDGSSSITGTVVRTIEAEPKYNFSNLSQYLLLVKKGTGSVEYQGETTQTTNLPFAWFLQKTGETNHLGMNYIKSTYYAEKEACLTAFKRLRIKVVIHSNDLEKIWNSSPTNTYAYPVYIARFGWFFIESIEKWRGINYCICKLVNIK